MYNQTYMMIIIPQINIDPATQATGAWKLSFYSRSAMFKAYFQGIYVKLREFKTRHVPLYGDSTGYIKYCNQMNLDRIGYIRKVITTNDS